MKLTGNHTIKAPASLIWEMLMDPDTLAKITPAIDKLELIGDDTYNAVADVRIGPVKGSFTGKVQIKDKNPTESFTLAVNQESKIGNAKAEIVLNLSSPSDQETEIKFEGDVKLSGLLATTGQRVISGVANMLSKQFFKALDEEVAARTA
ncbi:MAG: carbon monoxide dehydrogenase subunit G [Saprospiraceae bacterium]|jgi:carbon monoxide dehydrogenase subunit G|nr:carbon monoxide dehydrogenase subunit G [Saprospiraceae bacterium]